MKEMDNVLFWSLINENFYVQNFMKEMDIMKKLHHPNLVKMYGICVDKLPFYIILVDQLLDFSENKVLPSWNQMKLCLFCEYKRSIAKKETWKNIWRASSKEQGSWSEVRIFFPDYVYQNSWACSVSRFTF